MEDQKIQAALDAALGSYDFKYGGGLSVPATSRAQLKIHIASDAAFQSHSLTGFFTTLTGAAADGGACLLTCQWFDDGRDLQLFNDMIPLSLFLSPGRQRTSGVAGDPSNQLFFPIEFEYLFKPNSDLRIEINNAAAYANYVYFVLHGTKILKSGE